ncbi:MAG: tRNA (adenosine(37)-N6)-threonylcarbamoyltransferase complex ATPase subunit type 1 TsaE [Burkholderiales bacterium PBB1]|nr:MAG: tRNA (adenosine(37)-N6)-threonylcarbamoyltransferase complex ATPase subunit type 1 TsaE [Burkholderiales bacterium PBB1]
MPILEARTTRTVLWADEADCAATACELAGRPSLRHACIELHGNLGAGKTSFVRHLLRALGVSGPIKSPTYAVMEPYALPGLSIWHFDFYRFEDPQEFEDAGFREIFASPGLKLIEWPERAAGLLPTSDLRIEIAMTDAASGAATDQDDTRRQVTFQAGTPLGLSLLP